MSPATRFMPDHEGLICAYQLDRLVLREHDVLADLDAAGPLWLHFTLTDVRAQHWIEEKAPIPDEAGERGFAQRRGVRFRAPLT